MKILEPITALQSEQNKPGAPDILFGNGIECKITGVQHVAAKTPNHPAPAAGPHEFQPKRLVITGESISA